jgi:glycosyltransferase involved in cell wall biosynthesis
MIVIVAPYTPIKLTSKPHLGAARKIELIVKAISEVDDVVLVNTAHNNRNTSLEVVDYVMSDELTIKMVNLSCFSSSFFGKILNLFQVRSAWVEVLKLGNPRAVWLYNGYAFESLFSLCAPREIKVKTIMELEDWHLARSRGFNPKPYVDYFLWKKVMKKIDYCFVINDLMQARLSDYNVKSSLLQGMIDPKLETLSSNKFSGSINDKYLIGYFGGLSKEKGADVVFELSKILPKRFEMHVCGAGAMEDEFENIKLENFKFHGRVSDDELYETMCNCDIILNPHTPIDSMGGGVFPFKVVEAIASGAVLISTDLPRTAISGLLDSVEFYEGGVETLLSKIEEVAGKIRDGLVNENGRDSALNNFSKKSFLSEFIEVLND